MTVGTRVLRRPLSLLVAAALTLTGTATTLALTQRAAGAALDTTLYAIAADKRIYSFDETTGAATPISVVQPFGSAAIARQPGTGLLYIYEQTSSTTYRVATYDVVTKVTNIISTTFPYGLLRLAFRSDGELYGGVNNILYHLSPTTGAVISSSTLTGIASGGGDITFGADNRMYLVVNQTLATFAAFAAVPPATLAPTTSVAIPSGTRAHPGLSFGRTGKLFTVDSTVTNGVTTSALTYVDPTTGAETRFANTGLSFLDLTAAPNRSPTSGTIGPLSTPRDTPVTTTVTTGSTDPDGDPVALQTAGGAVNGSVTFNVATGTVTFTPTAGYSGAASYTYTLSDGNGGTVTKTVAVTVGPNTPPVAVNDTLSVAQNAAATTVPVLANDSDANNDPLTVTSITAASNGTATLTAGVVKYAPKAGFFGTDSFTYTISDAHTGTATATVNVTVTKPNTPPVYTAAATNTTQGIPAAGRPVPLAATDADGDTLSYSISGGSLPAGITLNANGTFSGAATGFGPSTVTIVVSDGKGGTASTTLTITVANGPPTAVPDSATTPQDVAVVVSPLTNDTDPNGDALSLVSATGASNGTLSVNTATGKVTYTPKAGFSGTDSFTYVVSDSRGASSTGTVNVTISFVNSPPVFTNTSNNTLQSILPLVTPAAVTATDPDNDPLTYALTSGLLPPGVTLNPNGSFSGTGGVAADYPVTITVSDGKGGTATTSLVLRIRNVAPVASDDADSTSTNTPVTTAVRFNDRDDNGDTLVVASVTQGAHGTGPTRTPTRSPTGTGAPPPRRSPSRWATPPRPSPPPARTPARRSRRAARRPTSWRPTRTATA